MAFTSAQKAKIRMWLGYPQLYRYANTRLEGALDVLDSDAEALVTDYLTKLDTVDTEIAAAFNQASGSLKRVDEIEFYNASSSGGSSSQSQSKLKQAAHWAGRISIILGVPFFADITSGAGYPGDQYTQDALGNPYGGNGRGGPIPLG